MSRRLGIGLVAVLSGVLAVALADTNPGSAAFPKGKTGRIIFGHLGPGGSELVTTNADGAAGRSLTDGELSSSEAVYSPDGGQIAFVRCDDGSCSDTDIWVMRGNGNRARSVIDDPAEDHDPSFSPDGARLLFTRLSGTQLDIWMADAKGRHQRNLTRTPTVSESGAVFSPDGRELAFRRSVGFEGDIFRMKANGRGLRALTDDHGSSGPSWAPNGKRIAFTRSDEGSCGCSIWTMNRNGGDERNVTPGFDPANNHGAAFSPNGKRIAFASPEGGEFDIWTVGLDGSGPVNVTEAYDELAGGTFQQTDPDWQTIRRCAGRRVTIVGDDGPDRIRGTKGADVIAGLGGKDRIKGRGGRDRICGGRGKDKLKGGDGKDKLDGGPGKDKEIQ